jgi:methionyl-tRNA formyltransferase
MKIFIITMDDPVQTKLFIKSIIDARPKDIIGVAVPKGDRLTLSKGKSKYFYLLSLLLIMGIFHFSKNVFVSLWHKLRKSFHRIGLAEDPTILGYAKRRGIPVFAIKTPNSKSFREQLELLKPDVIINQSQSIIKKELLNIPSIGVLNRHNALLPKNRGRLTPFWVLYRQERETGVSIHFVDEGLDSGAIVVQEKFTVSAKDTFNTLVKKNYQIAPRAMLNALSLLENGFNNFIANDNSLATYNSTPTLKEAMEYRLTRIKNLLK